MTRILLITLTSILFALPASASDLANPFSLVSTDSAAPSTAPVTLAMKAEEGRLSRELGLPASDFFALEEPVRGEQVAQDEPELRLPEDVLPESDIPLTFNSKVEYFVNYFQTSGRKAFAKWLSRSERYIPMMKDVLKREGMPEDLVYLAMIESGFSPHAYSVASAVGPWQFISGTGKRYSLRIDEWIDERRDPLKSTVAAALYLKELYSLFNNDWYLAAAGYNAGENKIMRAVSMYNTRDFWQLTRSGDYLKRETKEYVPKLLAAAIIAKDPAKYGFADVAYLPPVEYDAVQIPSQTDLELVAKLTDVSLQTIRELNPELRRWCTPPNYPNYQLKIPKGSKAKFETAYAAVPEDQRYTERIVYARYKAKKKDTLAAVAKRYNTTEEKLTELNRIKPGRSLAGRVLTVPVVATAARSPQQRDPEAVAAAEKGIFKKYYTVQKGDTLHSVAKRFNVSTKILMAWNNLKGRLVKPGKRIIVAKFVEKKGEMKPASTPES